MPLQLRTTTLSAAVATDGIRCYTKTVDGEVREARHGNTDAEVAKAIQGQDLAAAKQDQGWLPGLLRFHCSPDSSLCALAWGQSQQAIFYQAEDYTLRLKRREADGWVDTDFLQNDVLPGSNLATMHSAKGDRVMIIFQDKEGYLCYRCADNWKWDTAATRICQAVNCTGIGATSWNDLVDARMYYQDDKYTIREYLGGFSKEWRPVGGFELQYKTPVGDITAISWQDGDVHVRLYLQDDDDNIIEWMNEGKGWKKSNNFKETSLPEADITAFVRNAHSAAARSINVLWTGQDQILYQRVLPLSHGAWLEPAAIADLSNTGTNVGLWVGSHFSDNCPGVDAKRITKVVVRAGAVIDGLKLEYADAGATAWHGGLGGELQEFVLGEGEDITQIQVSFNEKHVQGLQFVTSKGSESPWFGMKSAEPTVWEYRGHALAGFMGTSDQYVNGLKPFWSTRLPTPTDLTLDETIRLVERVGVDVKASQTRIETLRARSNKYSKDVQEDLRAPAAQALDGVAQFIAVVEYLHELTALDKAARAAGRHELAHRTMDIKTNVQRCQEEAVAVSELFKALSSKAGKLVPEGEKIDQQTAKEKENAKSRDLALHHVQDVAEAFRLKAQKKLKALETSRALAEEKLCAAERESEKQFKELVAKQSRKEFWDKVTLGINNKLDPFGMKQGINKTAKQLADAQSAAAIASGNYTAASAAIAAVDAELRRIAELASAADAHHASLDGVVGAMEGLVEQNRALAQAATDLQTLLEKMHTESEQLDDQNTAETFAKAILEIGRLASSSQFLGTVMGDRAGEFEAAVARILGSPVDIDAAS